MSEQTQACEGFNNKSGDKHQLAKPLFFAASLSMLHLYASACKAIPRPLSDLPFLPGKILWIFRGSSLLICSTDRKKMRADKRLTLSGDGAFRLKNYKCPPSLLCTIVSYRKRQKQAVNFYYCSTKNAILVKERGLLPFYIIPPLSLL